MEATTGGTRASRTDVRHLTRHQLMGLGAQFVLGMVVAVTGQPSETTGTAHTVSTVFLALHVLLALALVAGAVMIIRAARVIPARRRMLAHWGALAIALTFVTGILTMITTSSGWSYAMAAGFAASLVLYFIMLLKAGDLAVQPE